MRYFLFYLAKKIIFIVQELMIYSRINLYEKYQEQKWDAVRRFAGYRKQKFEMSLKQIMCIYSTSISEQKPDAVLNKFEL